LQQLVRRHAVHPWAMPLDPQPPPVAVAPIAPAPAVAPAPSIVMAAVAPEPPAAPEKPKHRAKAHHHAKAPKPRTVAAKPASKDAADPLLGL
jgi:hypothetical protein